MGALTAAAASASRPLEAAITQHQNRSEPACARCAPAAGNRGLEAVDEFKMCSVL
jgi:hypothetical protein